MRPDFDSADVFRRKRHLGPGADVRVDNDASETATVVEASGRDRPGLLAALARTLADAGLSIVSAHIDGYGERAVDAFYVVDAKGAKITDTRRRNAVRNAVLARHPKVDIPASKLKAEIARILKEEGYIANFKVAEEGVKKTIKIYLKYATDNSPVITKIERVSRPGCRVYVGQDDIPRIQGGLGRFESTRCHTTVAQCPLQDPADRCVVVDEPDAGNLGAHVGNQRVSCAALTLAVQARRGERRISLETMLCN